MAYGSVNVPGNLPNKQNTLTGKPGQAVGFGPDGTATPVQGWSNPNLLDNWYFADPVNQRGQTEYLNNGYTIDRWRMDPNNGQARLDIMDGFIRGTKISPSPNLADHAQGMLTLIENPSLLAGKTVTFSVLHRGTGDSGMLFYGGGAVIAAKTLYSSEGWVLNSITCKLPEKDILTHLSCYLYFDVNKGHTTGYTDFLAAKLELGPVQTLARQDRDGSWVLNDPPPNKALELAKCQRYYYQSWSGGYINHKGIVTKAAVSGYYLDSVDFPAAMRTTPTVAIYTGEGAAGAVQRWESNEAISPVSTETGYTTSKRFRIGISAGLFTPGQAYQFHYSASADL